MGFTSPTAHPEPCLPHQYPALPTPPVPNGRLWPSSDLGWGWGGAEDSSAFCSRVSEGSTERAGKCRVSWETVTPGSGLDVWCPQLSFVAGPTKGSGEGSADSPGLEQMFKS